MQAGYYYLFIGLLFQFNITFKGIDILVDMVGYYFIYKGLQFLLDQNAYFQTANKIIIPLGILSAVNLYNFQYHTEIILSYSIIIDSLKIIVLAANMYLIFNLCKGSAEVAATTLKDSYLQNNIIQRLYFYLVVSGLLVLLSILSLLPFTTVNTSLRGVFTITYFAYILVIVIIVSGIHSFYRQLSTPPAKSKKNKQKNSGGKARKVKSKR
ncbi:MAG: hypothetical protein GX351_06610 [Peptococcaceae bacterium]|jgi:hypothetical protein|nr:hypothetical protein [Peptococcaceae bacterium]